jgi:hypothetical protein
MGSGRGNELTGTAWAPLREAVPSFRAAWNAYVDDPELYDAALPYANVTRLVEHLAGRAREGDWSELRSVFDVLEQLLRSGVDELANLLTVGFLEELHRDFEEFDFGLRNLSQLTRGSYTEAAWERAWNYRHPGQPEARDLSRDQR